MTDHDPDPTDNEDDARQAGVQGQREGATSGRQPRSSRVRTHLRPRADPAATPERTEMEEETRAEAEAACQTAGEEPREAVGYGRPPVASRFQPGQSGNPNGRPKGSQNKATLARPLNELVLQVARRGIALADDPDAPPVETIEMVLQALTNEALKGSLPAQKFLLEKYEVAVADEKAQANASSSRRLDIANMHPDDREMLKGILERSRQYANE